MNVSIRPVDLQIIIPRATDVGKTQQSSDHLLMSQQQQIAEQWQQISASRQQKVQSASKTEGGKVHREKEKKNQNKDSKHGTHPDEEQNSNDTNSCSRLTVQATDPTRGHLIDIKT